MNDMRVRRLDTHDLSAVAEALHAAGLPTSDINETTRAFFEFGNEAGALGFGGLEGDGPDQLLRSFVVAPAHRGKGLGGAMLAMLENEARAAGATNLHLLTDTAAPFFAKHGYRVADRIDAPPSIAHSREFTALCPASAAYLKKHLGRP